MPLNELTSQEMTANQSAGNKSANAGDGTQLDWDLIHKRMIEPSASLTWGDDLTDEALQQVWTRRAALLAQTIQEQEQGEQVEVAVIRLGREHYGLEVKYIFDIRKAVNITRVPRTPEWVAGVVNLRGQILSVIDLQRYLGLPTSETTTEAGSRHLLLVQTAQIELALLVDEVLSTRNLPAEHIQDATSVVRGLPAEYIQGVYIDKDNGDDKTTLTKNNEDTALLVILNLPALLTDKQLIIQEEIV